MTACEVAPARACDLCQDSRYENPQELEKSEPKRMIEFLRDNWFGSDHSIALMHESTKARPEAERS